MFKITVYLLLQANYDKIMHVCLDFDAKQIILSQFSSTKKVCSY